MKADVSVDLVGRAPRWSVRTLLVSLVLACLLPGILGAGVLFVQEYREGRAQLEKDTLQTARALSQAVDNQIFRVEALAQGLATTDSLARGDLATFHRHARLALQRAKLATSVVLIDRAGQQVLNTLKEYGDPLPPTGNPELVRQVFTTGAPVVSDLYTAAVLHRPIMTVAVPVMVQGTTWYALITPILPDRFGAILKTQGLPSAWTVSILDSRGAIAARTHDHEEFVGKKAAPEFLQRYLASREEVAKTRTQAGVPVLSVFTRSPSTQWGVAISIPRDALEARLKRRLSLLALGVIGLFAIGLGLASFMGEKIARSFRALRGPAAALGAGEMVDRPPVAVKEASEVTQAMVDASRLLEERDAALEAAARTLRESEERFRAMAESLPEIVFVANAEGGTEYVNSRWSEHMGLPREAAFGMQWAELIHADDRDDAARAWQASVASGNEFKHEHRFRVADGSYRWFQVRAQALPDASGRTAQWIGACTDIHDVKQSQERLRHVAMHDSLTGLPNRMLFQSRLQEALMRARRHRTAAAVMLVDLDHFKPINDSMGHQAGDAALQTVACRLQGLVRKTDMVARLGGDEFAVLLEDIRQTEEAGWVAQAMLDALRQPVALLGREVIMSASIGIACYPEDGAGASALLNNADAAMYRAKQETRSAYRYFAPEMNAQAEQKFFLANSLKSAVARNELVVYYQPRVCIVTGEVLGVEALVRWQSREHGLILPAHFIGLAEEIGMIEPIGEWVLRRACEEYVAWQAAGLAPEFVSVNVSPRQFGQPHLAAHLRTILAETGMPAQSLELELTESVVMQDPATSIKSLTELDELGVRLSLDDFGTGCSGLAYLKRFPISHLKIDRSFVRDIPQDQDDAAIVRAIIAMAGSLKLGITAEGVETEAQRAFLAAEGCPSAQGFLFSGPLSPEDLRPLLNARPEV